ncbi:MAG: hypothetical protein FJ004_00700 [Chloroflexi bacterium]|nr:hypothetical protein [Chloroflexota bacterium]
MTHKGKDSKGDVNRAFNTIMEFEHLDEDYTVQVPKESKTTEQSCLVVGGLEPKADLLPRFSFRWDQKANHLNVDIHGVNNTEKTRFERGENGYSGHVAQKVEQHGRFFDINILIPSKRVFKGRISFNLEFTQEAVVRIGVKAHANISVSH